MDEEIREDRLEEVGERVARLFVEIDSAKRVWDQGYQLGLAERRLIALLSDGQARTLRAISEEARLEQSTVNRQVNAALAAGLLERCRTAGSRAQLIAVSDKGLAAYRKDSVWGRRAFTSAMMELGEDDSTAFCELLERFADAYGHATNVQVHQVGAHDT
ncbi:helix-turn-helix domain-containing protein [Rhodococcus sp. T2V]|uniref:MarR family winged helix-turn-helix transcriptional regulator n=1 Tax=Rhodococcus sp. T2V TaxID=3034164 RepID=UPI0023E0D350|nr:helix-turn-helix domain-containing protein [Rhodococcus sp. T2V]MDF3313333.1 helix-turn-helix domain-containing protein [Rhodococcus sp. T2V]